MSILSISSLSYVPGGVTQAQKELMFILEAREKPSISSPKKENIVSGLTFTGEESESVASSRFSSLTKRHRSMDFPELGEKLLLVHLKRPNFTFHWRGITVLG